MASWRMLIIAAIVLLVALSTVDAFSTTCSTSHLPVRARVSKSYAKSVMMNDALQSQSPTNNINTIRGEGDDYENIHTTTIATTKSRRDWMRSSSMKVLAMGGWVVSVTNEPRVAKATVMNMDVVNSNKIFVAGQALTKDEALERFRIAKKDLQELSDQYDAIASRGGGDGVRRYLGTVGVTSGLYGIPKVLKRLQEEALDIVEFTEAMNDLDTELRAADTACYSANFVEFSAATGSAQQYLDTAKIDIQHMLQSMEIMAKELPL
mmetsp:Transcript_29364/g.53782  ORF Transcript_29364/g.53782 Transcript_29364/m.53782 type:complete len:265 (-) Transcript_29364:1208-2002(-)